MTSPGQFGDAALRHLGRPLGADGDRRGVDTAHQIRSAGSGIVVGGVVKRLHGHPHRRIDIGDLRVQLLYRRLGEDRARPHRLVALFLDVPAAGGVERDDAASTFRVGRMDVIPRQQRQSHQPLHRRRQVSAHHDREPVHLAGKRQRHAFELLVVLEFHRVKAGELDGDRGGAGDAGGGVVVGDVHLLHVAPGDHVALRRAPVARDDDPAGAFQRDDGGAMRQLRPGAAGLARRR